MSLCGVLSMVPFEEVLEWIQCGSKSGALELDNEHFHKTFYFVRGTLIGIVSSEPADSLAHRLHAQGILSADQVDAAGQLNRRTGRNLVQVLHKTGAVANTDLETAIDAQAKEAIYSVFLWPDGNFRFRDGVLYEDLPAAVSFEVTELVEEGRRRRARAAEAWKKLMGRTVPMRLQVEACEVVTRSPLQGEVAGLLERPQTVFSLMLATRASERDVLEVLMHLIDDGALRFEPGSESRAREVIASTRAAERSRRAVAGASASDEPTAVGVMESLATPAPLRTGARDLLARARREMERKHYEVALDLFRQAERADPADARLSMLRAGAESVYCEVLYRGELPPEAHPRGAVTGAAAGGLDPLSSRLFGEATGDRSVRELVKASGAGEIEALTALRDLKRNGYLDLLR